MNKGFVEFTREVGELAMARKFHVSTSSMDLGLC